jgi:hypothetical protein
MAILLGAVAGLVVLVIGWALGLKGFDMLLVTLLILLGAVGYHMVRPFLPGNREDPEDPRAGGSWTPR